MWWCMSLTQNLVVALLKCLVSFCDFTILPEPKLFQTNIRAYQIIQRGFPQPVVSNKPLISDWFVFCRTPKNNKKNEQEIKKLTFPKVINYCVKKFGRNRLFSGLLIAHSTQWKQNLKFERAAFEKKLKIWKISQNSKFLMQMSSPQPVLLIEFENSDLGWSVWWKSVGAENDRKSKIWFCEGHFFIL